MFSISMYLYSPACNFEFLNRHKKIRAHKQRLQYAILLRCDVQVTFGSSLMPCHWSNRKYTIVLLYYLHPFWLSFFFFLFLLMSFIFYAKIEKRKCKLILILGFSRINRNDANLNNVKMFLSKVRRQLEKWRYSWCACIAQMHKLHKWAAWNRTTLFDVPRELAIQFFFYSWNFNVAIKEAH